MAKLIAMNGMRPTGNLHLGHYTSALKMTVDIQNKKEYSNIYEMIADDQALSDNFNDPNKITSSILEVTLDYLSGGLDPSKVCIFLQSEIPALKEITFYFMDLVTLSRLERNPTVKTELKQKDFADNIPVGFLTYPISQAADIAGFDTDIVPAGEDQEPMIEQYNEIIKKFNFLYGNGNEILKPCKIMLPSNKSSFRLPGTDGKNKMSKSLNNCIYIKDDEETLKKKVMSMYTDPTHIKVSDPGHIEGNTVFTYLDAFSNDEHFKLFYPEFKNLDELKKQYQKGGIGDIKIKQFLLNILIKELKIVRDKRKEYEERIDDVVNILKEGNKKANIQANKVLKRIKQAIGLDYFNNTTLNKLLEIYKKKY